MRLTLFVAVLLVAGCDSPGELELLPPENARAVEQLEQMEELSIEILEDGTIYVLTAGAAEVNGEVK